MYKLPSPVTKQIPLFERLLNGCKTVHDLFIGRFNLLKMIPLLGKQWLKEKQDVNNTEKRSEKSNV